MLAGGFRHADDRLPRNLLEGHQARIAEAGQRHHISVGAVLGVGLERGVSRDGIGRPARHIAGPEATSDRNELRPGRRDLAGHAEH